MLLYYDTQHTIIKPVFCVEKEFVLNTKESKCQSIATIYIYIYIMINFIWLYVSTRNESSSGHLDLLL
jgi:hypothetical protein